MAIITLRILSSVGDAWRPPGHSRRLRPVQVVSLLETVVCSLRVSRGDVLFDGCWREICDRQRENDDDIRTDNPWSLINGDHLYVISHQVPSLESIVMAFGSVYGIRTVWTTTIGEHDNFDLTHPPNRIQIPPVISKQFFRQLFLCTSYNLCKRCDIISFFSKKIPENFISGFLAENFEVSWFHRHSFQWGSIRVIICRNVTVLSMHYSTGRVWMTPDSSNCSRFCQK